MLNIIQSMARWQKRAVLMALQMVLVPVALLVSALVLDVAAIGMDTLTIVVLMAPALMMFAGGFAHVLGLTQVPLAASENTDVAPAAVVASILAVISAALSGLTAVALPAGLHVVFGMTL